MRARGARRRGVFACGKAKGLRGLRGLKGLKGLTELDVELSPLGCHRLAELLFGRAERIGLHDEVGCDRAAAVHHSTIIRLERRARLARGVALERVGMHFDELSIGQELPLLLDAAT